jgi:hypothetical protein
MGHNLGSEMRGFSHAIAFAKVLRASRLEKAVSSRFTKRFGETGVAPSIRCHRSAARRTKPLLVDMPEQIVKAQRVFGD